MWAAQRCRCGGSMTMECREFQKIADSYLDDELLVETNHAIQQHLESCPACRQELAARRAMRSQLKSAVVKADASAIDPAFRSRMVNSLKHQALEERRSILSFQMLIPVIAGLIIVAGLIFAFVSRDLVLSTDSGISQQNVFKE